MITKRVFINFADTRIKAIDCISDIRKAAENAGLNLFSRYGIQLQCPMPDNGRVVVEIGIPEEMAKNFKYGHRLRGIATFLLNNCGGKYNEHILGNRLLIYTEIDNPIQQSDDLTGDEKVKAIAKFSKLLLRSDSVALRRIERILDILDEQD
ncbi:hypothetical protein [Butyrivibrio sp. AC2005]|uniref:hypothetical protein n=1 Tax=Butyrivibrio sp. AC2005 TaxID=1280672 RepID=UPI0004200B2B|nr:hypothetical protein [Butyrivibrio sp. AC2005]